MKNLSNYYEKQKRLILRDSKGFTLVEVLVALGIFVTVMMISVSSLVIVNNAALRAQQMRVLLDNLNFSFDSIVRTVRTAEMVSCGSSTTVPEDCSPTSGIRGTMLYVRSTLGKEEDILYRLQDGVLQKRIGDATNDWISMTSSDITIEQFDFYVEGAALNDTVQPIVRIFIRGVARTRGGEVSPFSFQTAVTPRAQL